LLYMLRDTGSIPGVDRAQTSEVLETSEVGVVHAAETPVRSPAWAVKTVVLVRIQQPCQISRPHGPLRGAFLGKGVELASRPVQ
jgi:hypothetical protein